MLFFPDIFQATRKVLVHIDIFFNACSNQKCLALVHRIVTLEPSKTIKYIIIQKYLLEVWLMSMCCSREVAKNVLMQKYPFFRKGSQKYMHIEMQ